MTTTSTKVAKQKEEFTLIFNTVFTKLSQCGTNKYSSLPDQFINCFLQKKQYFTLSTKKSLTKNVSCYI